MNPIVSSFAKTLVSKKEVGLFCPFTDRFLAKVFAATPPYDGTLARYYRIPGHVTYKLPDNLTLEDGALVCIRILLGRSAPGIDPGN
jgi:NADPH:quinone reductase-like Zn-dependent oxidoreductase